MSLDCARLTAWSRSPVRALHIYLVAGVIGLAAYLVVYGWSHLIGTSAYWQMPQQDERMALMGYRYFLYDTWHFPVFINHAVNVPYPKSVAFLDCIPIWALLNKLIATVIPPWESFSSRAYLGLWHALVYILQACFGVACLRALGHQTWRTGIVTAVCCIAVPTWIYRYGHPALSAHWVLLWALYLYLRTPPGRPSPRGLGVAKLCQLAVAALISPYLPVMSASVFIPSLVRSRDRRTVAIWLPLGVLSIGLATWFAGYFAPEIGNRQWGFAQESANLLSWLVPQRSGIVGDAQWIANVNGTAWQYEGYAYLGLGYLALLVLFILLTRHARLMRAVIARHRFLFVVVIASCVFALSNHIYFGSHEILSYSLPKSMRWIAGQFRSPGRFVWIPSYVLILFLQHWAFTQFSSARRFLVVAAVALLQVVDATGEWALQRSWTADRDTEPDLASWRQLVHAHDAVFILPTYTCFKSEHNPQLDHGSMVLQVLASERALPINGTYSARALRQCDAEEREWPTLDLRPNTLYVLLPPASAIASRFAAKAAHCGVSDLWRVCSTNQRAVAEAMRTGLLRPPPAPISLAYGQTLALANATTLAANWSDAERGGRWTTSSVADIPLHLDGEPPPRVALKLQLQARLCGQRQVQDVDVLLGDTTLATLHLDTTSNDATTERELVIPDPSVLRHPMIVLQLRPHDIRPPVKLGCDAEPRTLGVWVSHLRFE